MTGFLNGMIFLNGDFLYLKPVIAFVTVRAERFAAGQADPVGTGLFTAALAVVAVEDLGGGRQGDPGIHGIEQLFAAAVKVIALGFFRSHIQRFGFESHH